MRRASIWTLVIFAMACVPAAVSGGCAFEAAPTAPAASATLTPWTYLPYTSRQTLSALTWYGITRAPVDDWPTIKENLGGSVVDLIVYPYTPLSEILTSLDSADSLAYQVVFHIYDGDTPTNNPWYLNAADEWVFPQSAIDTLEAVSDHPALLAVYALHEPLDEGEAHVPVEKQRELYQLLKIYTDGLPVYTDMGGLSPWEDQGVDLTDGICDYCRTGPSYFRSGWTSEQCIAETLSRIDADLDTQQRLMPNSQVVFAINTYAFADYQYPIRLPTAYELDVVRDYLCNLDQPMLYHPWHYSTYDATLEDAPELWPVIAEGCDEQIPVTQTNTIIIDHNAVDASVIPQAWLDEARVLVTFFNHKSIGNNILDGIADLQAQDPGRYSISVQFSNGTSPGINHYQAGSNGAPLTKISGFADNVQDGHDLAFMKFCTGDCECIQGDTPIDQVWAAYREMMIAEQAEHPNTVLAWWTWPIIASNNSRAYCNEELAEFNDAVRAYVDANGGVLFDIADIESHDPDGNPVYYNGWEAAYPDYTTDGAHLSEMGRQRVASAMWWLLARVAGWGSAEAWISLTAVTDAASVHLAETAVYNLLLTASAGFTDPVSLTLQGAPPETTLSFIPNPITPPDTAHLYITTTASTPVGTYSMTTVASAGAFTDTADLTLIVASATPSFTLSISPTTRTAKPNQVVSYTTFVTGLNGFSQPVSLTIVGLPTGVGAAWSTNPVTPDGFSILTLSIPSAPPFGDHSLQIIGTADTQVVIKILGLIIVYPFRIYLPIILRNVF
ncbi:MAG: hypothetical protein DRI80_00120 [Chloroflexota bacterium]|nr:MAG: hypothetical protein DRI80_00120 [Chloroflexota bacterium]